MNRNILHLAKRLAIHSVIGIAIILVLYFIEWQFISMDRNWAEENLLICLWVLMPIPPLAGCFVFSYLSCPHLGDRIFPYAIGNPAMYVYVGNALINGGPKISGIFGQLIAYSWVFVITSFLGIIMGDQLYKRLNYPQND